MWFYEAPHMNLHHEIVEYARKIDVPQNLLPLKQDDNKAYECLWVDSDGPLFRYFYRERGETELIIQSTDRDVVLERIFSDITFSMASDYELKHRIEGQDSRRQLFAVEENLMRQLKPEWGDNEIKRHVEILKENPFLDKIQ